MVSKVTFVSKSTPGASGAIGDFDTVGFGNNRAHGSIHSRAVIRGFPRKSQWFNGTVDRKLKSAQGVICSNTAPNRLRSGNLSMIAPSMRICVRDSQSSLHIHEPMPLKLATATYTSPVMAANARARSMRPTRVASPSLAIRAMAMTTSARTGRKLPNGIGSAIAIANTKIGNASSPLHRSAREDCQTAWVDNRLNSGNDRNAGAND